MVRGGASCAPTRSCSLHVRSSGGEDGGEKVEGPDECGARVADGDGNELHRSPLSPAGRNEGGYFSILISVLMLQPKSPQKPISKRMRVHFFLSSEVGSGKGVSGISLA